MDIRGLAAIVSKSYFQKLSPELFFPSSLVSSFAVNQPLSLQDSHIMIFGIGVDIMQIARLREAVEKWGERFLRRVFTEGEIAHCFKKADPYPSLSVRFAAKEAFIKAIGSRASSSWTDIEVSNDTLGKPTIRGLGKFEIFLRENFVRHVHLSLSHEKEYGIACVVLETE